MRKKEHTSRHAPAFILLFLARGCDYGGSLLAAMQQEMPHFFGDSATTYRTLRSLEKEECIVSQWKVQTAGRPKRIYSLTPKGWERLEEYAADIQMRLENFRFFQSSLAAARRARPRVTADSASAPAGTVPERGTPALETAPERDTPTPETALERDAFTAFETAPPAGAPEVSKTAPGTKARAVNGTGLEIQPEAKT